MEELDRLHPLIIPINAHVYIVKNQVVFDTDDAVKQIMQSPSIVLLLKLVKPDVNVDEIKLRDET